MEQKKSGGQCQNKMKKKTIGIIGTNGLPGNYGGWDQLVIHLTKNLKDRFSFIVYTSYKDVVPDYKGHNGAKIKVLNFKANGIQSIPFDIASMIHAVFSCDVLFICGVSGCVFLPFIRLFKKRIILNPDGQEWKRGKWSKPVQWFLKLSEHVGVKFATHIISDNKKIQEYVKNEYNKESFVIEYGGDHVLNVELEDKTAQHYGVKKNGYAFKVCRIVPENNIHMILSAFSKYPSKDLILIGNWEHSNYGINLREKYRNYSNLKLLNPIFDQKVLDELRNNCNIYIHGHSVGGTNPSLVEAMNLGLFIVAFGAEYNIETTENKAVYFNNELDLLNILNMIDNNQIDQNASKLAMKEIAKRRYRWEIITDKYAEVFNL